MMTWQAHDLLWLDRSSLIAKDETQGLPYWVTEGNGPVVVRREKMATTTLIAVGVRGANKRQRYAAYASVGAVQSSITPYDIAKGQAWMEHPDRFTMPVLQALASVAPVLDGYDLPWGITGSLGYELATGEQQIHADSDLDLVIQSPEPLTKSCARDIWQNFGELPCRLDIQIETPTGAIALLEWAGQSQTVLLKSETGPFLVRDPWREEVSL
ncbi:malonate decarboxylase holo-ACP synthase [Marinomonas spartinae]|uniref:malonate decarboxylase holo-ACP synthase n=1 Tax=Marinomonas spartinae TaxID=1792290 RepID=UPI0018F2084B|nr:malonate decarboxylase holo-ACP synthase [Marinomonas spartinae]MBJ7555071.1 malonate decarboxylase holo-ACP synthase [Marinomonas spartinae]